MYSQGLFVLAAAALANAATPRGFEPGSQTDLFVTYGNLAAVNGENVERNCTSHALQRHPSP